MRRFYVVPKSVLYDPVPGRSDVRHHDLFMSAGGAHWIDLDGTHVLLCCGDFKRYGDEQAWHAHPEVARLHHPSSDRPMSELHFPENAHKKFGHKHARALAKIGVFPRHTVKEVSAIASKIHPLVSLGEEY